MPSLRFQLWIDGVGGYLVCGGDEIVLGQPGGPGEVDVPLLADLSRRHAVVRRDGEGHVLTPVRRVQLNGNELTAARALVDGDQMELGGSVSLRYVKGNPLSNTARLDFVSRHRTSPNCDAVVLLAETMILGPGRSSHVECHTWPGDVIVHRVGDSLRVRGKGEFMIDGVLQRDKGVLTTRSRVVGDNFSFTLEPL